MFMDDRPVPVRAEYFNVFNTVALFWAPELYDHEELALRELEALRGSGYVLLDVRAEADFNQGHIQGALNLPVGGIESASRRLIPPSSTVVVYGRSPGCAQSAVAADKLKTLGFEKVLRFTGGLEEWAAAGNRVVKTAPALARENIGKHVGPEAA